MKIHTSRFGSVDIQPDDILFFRSGIFGFEECQHWVILADAGNRAVAWLQSMQVPDVALPVVSPRRFVPDYQVRLDPLDIETLHLNSVSQAYVLVVVSRDTDVLTLNLRAPIIINLDRRLGCQVVTTDQQPVQYELTAIPLPLRRIA
jgi:flagellar assembly factor FliW